MTSEGFTFEIVVKEEGKVREVGEIGEVEETGERAESTESVVTVELDLSTLRCDWESSSPPEYMSAKIPLSAEH